jgi:excisionase family DNA binding protein
MSAAQKDAAHMTATEPSPVMFRISTVVKLTGLSRSVIYEQIRAGRLPTVKQGTATLITAAALDDYVRLLEQEARSRQ